MTKKKEWKQFVLLLMLLLLWLLLILYLHSTETDRLTFLCDQWKVAVQSCFHEQLLLLSSTSCCDPRSLLLFSFFPELVENQDDASFFSKWHNKTPWENYQLFLFLFCKWVCQRLKVLIIWFFDASSICVSTTTHTNLKFEICTRDLRDEVGIMKSWSNWFDLACMLQNLKSIITWSLFLGGEDFGKWHQGT